MDLKLNIFGRTSQPPSFIITAFQFSALEVMKEGREEGGGGGWGHISFSRSLKAKKMPV